MLRLSLVNNHITFIEKIIIVLKDAKNIVLILQFLGRKVLVKIKEKEKENIEFSRYT